MNRLMILFLVVLAGCPAEPPPPIERTELVSITNPPPASTGAIRTTDVDGTDIYKIDLSVGVALATRCWDTCEYDSVCNDPKLTASDPSLLGVLPVYRQGLHGEFALIASKVGTTTLHVETSCVSADYEVTIIPRTP